MNEILVVPRLDMKSGAFKWVSWIVYSMSVIIALMAFPLEEYGLIGVGAGFALMFYLFFKLLQKDKVRLSADEIVQTSFGKTTRKFTKEQITSICGYTSSVNVAKIAASRALAGGSNIAGAIDVSKVPLADLASKYPKTGARFILVSTNDAPQTFHPTRMAGNKKVILFHWHKDAMNLIEQHYAHLISE